MTLLESLFDAIIRLDGEALVMHVGEKPYVVLNSTSINKFRGPVAWGQVELSSRPLTGDAVLGMLAQILSLEQRQSLDELGAIEEEVNAPDGTGQRFIVTAARGGEDVWVEVRRRNTALPVPALVDTEVAAAGSSHGSGLEAVSADAAALPASPETGETTGAGQASHNSSRAERNTAVAADAETALAEKMTALAAHAEAALAASKATLAAESEAALAEKMADLTAQADDALAAKQAALAAAAEAALAAKESELDARAAALLKVKVAALTAETEAVLAAKDAALAAQTEAALAAKQGALAAETRAAVAAEAQRALEQKIAALAAESQRTLEERAAAVAAEAERVLTEREKALAAQADRVIAEREAALRAAADRLFAERRAALAAEADRVFAERESALAAESDRVVAERQAALAAEADRVFAERQSALAAEAARLTAERDAALTSFERAAAEREAALAAEAQRILVAKDALAADVERSMSEREAALAAEAERIRAARESLAVEAERTMAKASAALAAAEAAIAEREAAVTAAAGRAAAARIAEAEAVIAAREQAVAADVERQLAERIARAEEALAAHKADAERMVAARIAQAEGELAARSAALAADTEAAVATEVARVLADREAALAAEAARVLADREAALAAEAARVLADREAALAAEAARVLADREAALAAEAKRLLAEQQASLTAETSRLLAEREAALAADREAARLSEEATALAVEAEAARLADEQAALPAQAEADAAIAGAAVVRSIPRPLKLQPPQSVPAPAAASTQASLVELLRAAAGHRASTVYALVDARPMMRVEGQIALVGIQATIVSGDVERFIYEFAPRDLVANAAPEWTCVVPGVGRVRCVTFHDQSGAGLIFHLPPGEVITSGEVELGPELRALCGEADGLIVVAGPRSSGKSALLSAFVDVINSTRCDHVITIESQIRRVHDKRLSFISQREVRGDGDAIGTAARAALREGPDVLVIEDLRAPEALVAALDAARAGRLVFGSISAPTAPGAIERLIDAFPADRRPQVRASLAGALRAVVAQILVPKVTGGRIAAREVLLSSPAVRKLVLDGATSQLPIAIESGRSLGMKTMIDSLGALVRDGIVDIGTACACAPDRDALVLALVRDGIDVSGVERRA